MVCMRVLMKFCSFAVICFLVYVHLGPARWQPPRTGLGWQLDHFLGYFAATSIVWLGWPNRPFVVGGFLMVKCWKRCKSSHRIAMPIFTLRCMAHARGADAGFACSTL